MLFFIALIIVACLLLLFLRVYSKKLPDFKYKIIIIDLLIMVCAIAAINLLMKYKNVKPQAPTTQDVHDGWTTVSGYRVETVVAGLDTPVAIDFVQQSEDIKFLFSDLKGPINGVTTAGKVIKLAHAPDAHQTKAALDQWEGQSGQTGLCITHDNKFIFTTGVYFEGTRRLNRIIKWELKKSNSLVKIGEFVFRDTDASLAHQIGHCLITQDNKILVGIGDARHMHKVRDVHNLNKSNGKIVRLNLNLSPSHENPFYSPDNRYSITSMIYASGLRNPFAIAETEGGLYLADNGDFTDRLVKIIKGKDYPWDGNEASLIYNNLVTWPRSIAPSDMIYIPKNNQLFPRLRGNLIIAASYRRGLIAVPIDDTLGVTGNPKIILHPANAPFSVLTPRSPINKSSFNGLALGEDGIYISYVSNFDKPNTGEILRLVPFQDEITRQKTIPHGDVIFDIYQCRGCHRINDWGSSQAPNLDNIFSIVKERLQSAEYLQKLSELEDQVEDEASNSRKKILAIMKKAKTDSSDEQIREAVHLWITTKLRHPKFYDKNHVMPSLELESKVIEAMADELIRVAD